MQTVPTGIPEVVQDSTNELQVPGASCNIYWINPEHALEYWQLGYKYIEAAMLDLQLSSLSMADVLKGLLEERYQLWSISKEGEMLGIIVTEIYYIPEGKVCNILLVGGDEFERWRAGALKAVQQFATHFKCDWLLATGRPGWKKWAKTCGFDLKFVTYACALGGEND